MNDFRLFLPVDVRFGKNSLNYLPEILQQYGKKVLLAYGGGSIKKVGLYDKVVKILKEHSFEITELSGIEPNPRIESVRDGVELIRKNKLDVILAVGGGSVVDCAKVIAAGVYYDGDAWDLLENSKLIGKAVPLIDVLTLAATGTEMNRNAVISDIKNQKKLGTSGFELLPKASILNPENTFSVPLIQTSAGIADTLSHLFEQYFDNTEAMDVSDGIIEGILRAMIKNAKQGLDEPNNYDVRSILMWGSTMALNGITSVGRGTAWTCHPLEHELSAFYDITHGIGLAILTPRWMKFCIEKDTKSHKKFVSYAENVWHIFEGDDKTKALTAVQKTYNFFKDVLKIPMTLQEIGIKDDTKVELMSKQAIKYAALDKAFVSLSEQDCSHIFKECFKAM